MSWTQNTLSTTDSIVRHLSRILTNTNYTTGSNGQWQDKFDLAKLKLGNDIYSRLGQSYSLDNITNPLTLVIASDYLTLALVFTELASQGLNLVWLNKKLWYYRQYAYLLTAVIPRLAFYNYTQSIVSGVLSL